MNDQNFIRVPRTENGKKYLENESSTYRETDFDDIRLDASDVRILTPTFLEWNREFGILIDDCEQEILPANFVGAALGSLESHSENSADDVPAFEKIKRALVLALNRKVPIEISL